MNPRDRVVFRANVEFKVDLRLTEVEARALDGLTRYGFEAFLKVFKEKLGTAYIRDHEAGLKSFFDTVRSDIIPALHDVDEAKRAISDNLKARNK